MIPVLTTEQAYKLDKDTIQSGHLSQADLMDNAGRAVAQFFCEKIKNPFNKKVVVVCGKGNNGGDGVIAHSYLKKYNISSKIVFTEEKHNHSKLIKKYKISQSDYTIYSDKINFDNYDWIIDGIFGIGFSGELNNKYSDLFQKINYNKNIISIDLPSGCLDVYDDNLIIASNYTITFGHYKFSHFMNPINNLSIVDIGFKNVNKISIFKINSDDIKDILLNDSIKTKKHKKNTECLIYAGNINYPGAAILSSLAANKTGSGYINLFTYFNDEEFKNKLPEIIVKHPLKIKELWSENRMHPVLIGPGDTYLEDFVSLADMYSKPYNLERTKFVLDAGVFQEYGAYSEPEVISFEDRFPNNSIMTPHLGELMRFFGNSFHVEDELPSLDLFNTIQNALSDRIMIVKSFNTFIITKDMIYIMDKGPSLLATAGTGDVLSGILVSLLSQGYSRLEASILGTYLHAEAANYYMNNISKDGMTASDLIDCIPHAFNILRNNE